MKTGYKLAALFCALLALAAAGFAQNIAGERPQTTTQNLVRGVIGPVSSSNNWSNYSIFNEVPGTALFPVTSSTTVFYYGFTAGTQADINNMVVYTTARDSSTITAVTPVTLGGISNPSINLASTSNCAVAPSAAVPCVIRFDPTSITMTPSSDYYFVVYFASDSNNSALGGAQPVYGVPESSFGAWYLGGDNSRLKVGQSLPAGSRAQPIFLLYVMSN